MKKKEQTNKFAVNVKNRTVGIVNTNDTKLYDEPIPGFYRPTVSYQSMMGMMTSSISISQIEVNIPVSAQSTTKHLLDINEVLAYLGEDSRRIHNAMGIPAKYGILLHGKQGTGKTTAMLACADKFIKDFGAIAILVGNMDSIQAAYDFIRQCQEIKEDQIFLVLHDECEHAMKEEENIMKGLLDGPDTPNNLIYIGTTNYIEKIPNTIIDRPSRIKEVLDCSKLNEEEEIVFSILNEMNIPLEKKDQLSREELVKLCPSNKGKSIDELKHIFLEAVLNRKTETVEQTKQVTKKSRKVAEPTLD